MASSMLDSSVTAEVINPIIVATTKTFETMLSCRPVRTGLTVVNDWSTKHEISAVISLSGNIVGTVIFSIPAPSACEIYYRMTEERLSEVSDKVRDAIAEVCNMIAGAAKAQLEVHQMRLGIPNVIQGKDVAVHYPNCVQQPMCLWFSSEIGEFTIEAGFAKNLNEHHQ